MPTQSQSIAGVIGMILLILGVSLLIPAMFVSLSNQQTQALTQQEGERTVLTGTLSSEVVNVATQGGGSANVTVFDSNTGTINSTGEMDEGDTVTIILNGEEIDVELLTAVSSSEAIIQYTYPLSLGLPDGVEVILDNITLIIMFMTIFLVLGVLLTINEVFLE